MQPLVIHNNLPVLFCHIYNITLVNYPHDITGSHAKNPINYDDIPEFWYQTHFPQNKLFWPWPTPIFRTSPGHHETSGRDERERGRPLSLSGGKFDGLWMFMIDMSTLWQNFDEFIDQFCNRGAHTACMLVFLPVQMRYLRCWELYRMSLAETSWKGCRPVGQPTDPKIPKGWSWFAGNLVLSLNCFGQQLVTGYTYTLETVNSAPCFAAWECCIRK